MIDLNPNHLATVERILTEHVPECAVRAFGSRATWTSKDYSDLDLAIVGSGPLDRRTLGRLKEALEDSDLPIRVDVLDWHSISESFRKVIERDYVVVQEGAKPTPSNGWREVTLGDFAPFTYGKGLRTGDRNPSGDVPVIGSNGIIGYHDTPLTKGPTIVIGRKGTVGAVHYFPVPCWPIDTTFFITGGDSDLLKFRYYAIKSLPLQEMNADSAVPGLNRNDAHACLVRVPDEAEQRAIAHILGTLDDKIELNRRMNETLEAMARALFKSWFVDFEPVRAKMEGRWQRGESLPGLPAEHYDLFPDRLVDSELGEIPEGWGVKGLGDVARQRRSGVKPDEIDAESPYIALEHMPKRCIALTQWSNADGLASGKFKFEQGDILFGKLRPYFHKVGVAPLDGVCSTDIVVVHPKSNLWFGFVLGHTSSAEFVDYTDATSTGTRMPRTKWSDMERYKIALPSSDVARAFGDVVQPWIDSILSAIHESRSLAAQRNALLPRLVSRGGV